MDYEKKYKEALERARIWQNHLYDTNDKDYANELNYIFPELAESGDEKIRKQILSFLKEFEYDHYRNLDFSAWIAWLEKQEEKKPTLPKWKYKNDNTPLLRDSLILNKYGCVAKSPSGAFVNDVWVIDYDELAKLLKEELEKQGEQKSIDKFEPKFKVGDWVVFDNGNVEHITSVGTHGYTFDDGDYLLHDECDKIAHLWSIQDAKDGDVLFHSDSASNGIFIFKEIIDKGFAKEVICYCDYDSEDHFCLGEHHTCCWTDAKILYPATKEQRDLLFQKMKEAGYIFDFKNKELKKIKNEITIPFGAKDSELQEATYFIPKGFYAEIDNDKVVIKKGEKPATWSEEDERNMQNIDTVLFYDRKLPEDICAKLRNFLKTLKERIGWKPSEEQIKAFEHFVRSIGESGYVSPYENNTKLLYSLLEQLKKL